MEVYNSKYIHLAFFAEQKLIEMTWQPTSAKMTEDEYKQEMLNYLDAILKFRPQRSLTDIRDMFFIIVPELQEWSNQVIAPKVLEIGLNKAAIVMSKNIFSQVSVEQTMTEGVGNKFINRYFDSKEEAKEWLLSL